MVSPPQASKLRCASSSRQKQIPTLLSGSIVSVFRGGAGTSLLVVFRENAGECPLNLLPLLLSMSRTFVDVITAERARSGGARGQDARKSALPPPPLRSCLPSIARVDCARAAREYTNRYSAHSRGGEPDEFFTWRASPDSRARLTLPYRKYLAFRALRAAYLPDTRIVHLKRSGTSRSVFISVFTSVFTREMCVGDGALRL